MIRSEYAKKAMRPDEEKLHEMRRFADYAWNAVREGDEKTVNDEETRETARASVDFALVYAAYLFLTFKEESGGDEKKIPEKVFSKMREYTIFEDWTGEKGFGEALKMVLKKAEEPAETENRVRWDAGDFAAYVLSFNSRAADAVGDRSGHAYRMAWTPRNVSDLAIDLLEIGSFDSVADFGCGMAAFLKEVFLRKLGGSWFGVESSRYSREIALIRKELLGAREFEIMDAPSDEENNAFLLDENRRFDRIFVQAPMWDRADVARTHIRDYRDYLIRYAERHPEAGEDLPGADSPAWERYEEWRDDWAFFLLAFEHLNEGGRAVVITDGAGLTGEGGVMLRKAFLKKGLITAVITVDGSVLNYRSRPFSIVLFEKRERQGLPVKMIDARPLWSENDGTFLTDDKRERIMDLLKNGEETGALSDREVREGRTVYRMLSPEEISSAADLRPEYYLNEKKYRQAEPLGTYYSVSRSRASLDPADPNPIKQISFSTLLSAGDRSGDGIRVKEITSEDKTSTFGAEVRDCGLMISRTFPLQTRIVRKLKDARTVLGINAYLIEWNESSLPEEEKEKELCFLQAFFESEYGKQTLKLMSNERIVHIGALKELKIPFPEEAERRRIGEIFRKRKEEIARHRRIIDELENEIDEGEEFRPLLAESNKISRKR